MTKIKNEQRIGRIAMYPIAYTKCVIGGDWYKNELEIEFVPADCYPDYMDVNDYIMQEIDGQELNIEDVVDKVYQYLQVNYEPQSLVVIDHIKGCKTHFDVDVIKYN